MFEYIEFIICYGEGVKPEALKELNRKQNIVFTRQLIMYFSVFFKVGSYEHIAEQFGGMDHASVNHAIKTINNYIDTDKAIQGKVLYYENLLKKVLKITEKVDDLSGILKPLEKEISELESRCINLTVQLAFLKEKTFAI